MVGVKMALLGEVGIFYAFLGLGKSRLDKRIRRCLERFMKAFDKILVVDDDQDVLLAARLFLKPHAEQIVTEPDPNLIPTLLQDDT
jgi:hypothetical protein